MYSAAFNTSLGWLGATVSDKGLCRVILPRKSREEVTHLLKIKDCIFSPPSPLLDGLVQRLERYLQGMMVEFPEELDVGKASPFQQAVWKMTRSIPYGETRSYGWLASKIGNPTAIRAVGQALAANPVPLVVPCHRVIGSDGKLTGYAGGVALKRKLLALEASAVTAGQQASGNSAAGLSG